MSAPNRLTVEETARHIWWNEADKPGTARRWFEDAVRGRILQVDDDGLGYHFVVPEIGYLLHAIHRSWREPFFTLQVASREFQENEPGRAAQFFLEFARWEAKQTGQLQASQSV